jgi:peptidoglycan-associated lipoprotein
MGNMTMHGTSRTFVAIGLALLLGACASNVKLDEPAPVESRTGTSPDAAGGAGAGAGGQSQVSTVDLSKKDPTAGLQKTIYFDYDSYVVRDEFRPTVDQYAKLLNGDRKKRLTIEGHTDERGGREYNLALGQKRAEAVQKSLTLLGVADAQVEAVSYGKERPAVPGNDETAYAKNRRAELIQK